MEYGIHKSIAVNGVQLLLIPKRKGWGVKIAKHMLLFQRVSPSYFCSSIQKKINIKEPLGSTVCDTSAPSLNHAFPLGLHG